MWIEIRSADFGGGAPNSTYGVLKSLNVHRNSTSSSTRLTGRSERQGDVPHLLPDAGAVDGGGLVQLVGMFCIPAISMRNANGQVRQTATTASGQEGVVADQPERPRRRATCRFVDQHVVEQAVVPLEHEAPRDDAGVDGQRVRHEEQGAQQRPRPRKRRCSTTAADIPNVQDSPTTSTV